jgi:hypothetical protein
MASFAPARSLAAAGLALVLSVGSGIALAAQAAANTPSCGVTSTSQPSPITCAPVAPVTPNTGGIGGAPSEQDLTSANSGRHH